MKFSINNRFGLLAAFTTATSVLSLGIALPAAAAGEGRSYGNFTPAVAACVRNTTTAPGAVSIVNTPSGPYSGTVQVTPFIGGAYVATYASNPANHTTRFTIVQNALPAIYLWNGLDTTVTGCGGTVIG